MKRAALTRERRQKVLTLRRNGLSLAQVAFILKCTRERVRQIEADAIADVLSGKLPGFLPLVGHETVVAQRCFPNLLRGAMPAWRE